MTKLGTVLHAYSLRITKAKAGVSQDQDQTGLHSEFEASLGYLERLCLKGAKNKQRKCK
jgi:hypothetical protein